MNIQDNLDYAVKQFQLTDMTIIYEQQSRTIYRAHSAEWGNVIVKINDSVATLRNEYTMLHRLQGNGCCKVYVFDEERGILIEERLCPGIVLREERNPENRIRIFATVFSQIHSYMPENTEYPTYLDWLGKADKFCREQVAEQEIKEDMHKAYEIGCELFDKYQERILLHGDLHHDNILQNETGGYSMIDPKGVVGPEIFDVPRFLLNEFDYAEESAARIHIGKMLELVVEIMGYDRQDIKKLLFMETVLANVWSLEDGEPVDRHLIQVTRALSD